METIEDIITQMRKPSIYKGKVPVSRVDADFRYFADKLEAAIAQNPPHCGNTAKMREALETISKCDISKEEDCYTLYRVCETALSAPARNCDLYTSADDAWNAFRRINPPIDMPPLLESLMFREWLFAKAKGEENNDN